MAPAKDRCPTGVYVGRNKECQRLIDTHKPMHPRVSCKWLSGRLYAFCVMDPGMSSSRVFVQQIECLFRHHTEGAWLIFAPMEPGMSPSWPSLAGVAPLRVTHRSRSTASPVRGSCPHACPSASVPVSARPSAGILVWPPAKLLDARHARTPVLQASRRPVQQLAWVLTWHTGGIGDC